MSISASNLEEAFPAVKAGVVPLGQKVLVQLRMVRSRTAGGIALVRETKDFNKDIGTMAKVLALGPIAYKNRDSGAEWKEGAWVQPGDYVRVIRYGGDRFRRPLNEDEDVEFLILNDYEIYAKVDPEAFESIDELK